MSAKFNGINIGKAKANGFEINEIKLNGNVLYSVKYGYVELDIYTMLGLNTTKEEGAIIAEKLFDNYLLIGDLLSKKIYIYKFENGNFIRIITSDNDSYLSEIANKLTRNLTICYNDNSRYFFLKEYQGYSSEAKIYGFRINENDTLSSNFNDLCNNDNYFHGSGAYTFSKNGEVFFVSSRPITSKLKKYITAFDLRTQEPSIIGTIYYSTSITNSYIIVESDYYGDRISLTEFDVSNNNGASFKIYDIDKDNKTITEKTYSGIDLSNLNISNVCLNKDGSKIHIGTRGDITLLYTLTLDENNNYVSESSEHESSPNFNENSIIIYRYIDDYNHLLRFDFNGDDLKYRIRIINDGTGSYNYNSTNPPRFYKNCDLAYSINKSSSVLDALHIYYTIEFIDGTYKRTTHTIASNKYYNRDLTENSADNVVKTIYREYINEILLGIDIMDGPAFCDNLMFDIRRANKQTHDLVDLNNAYTPILSLTNNIQNVTTRRKLFKIGNIYIANFSYFGAAGQSQIAAIRYGRLL